MAQKNSLDNLMMTFADLNATGKSSFKGPALKDVKKVVNNNQKSSSAFQPSQKARDWSSLEQSLESVFSVNDLAPAQATQLPFQPQFSATDDDEFSDFVGPSTTQTIPNAGIGSRLATFQDESPVHQFKAKPPDWTSPTTGQDQFASSFSIQQPSVSQSSNFVGFQDVQENDDDDDDFGDFAAPAVAKPEPVKTFPAFDLPSIPKGPVELKSESFKLPIDNSPQLQVQSSTPQVVPSFEIQSNPIFNMPSEPKPTSIPKTLPLQPSLNTNSNDKYSALRDLLMDDSSTLEPQTSSLPVLESSSKGLEEEEDDFGDFVTTTTTTVAQLAPLSLPINDTLFPSNSSSLLPDETVFTSSKPKPKEPEDKFVPWLESSPPPPPIEDNLNIEEDLNVGVGEGFLNDDPFFGVGLPSDQGQNQVEDLSIASLNLRSITPKIEPQDEPLQEPLDEDIIERESGSLDNTDEDIIADNIEREALKLFQKTLKLLDVNESVLKEVLGADKTKSFLWNLVQVYRVCQRLQQGRRQRQVNIQHLIDDSWIKIQDKIKTTYSFTPLLWDFSDCCSNNAINASNDVCKICLLDLTTTSKETRTKDLVESVITHNDCSYHSICANFWINAVNPVLPN